MKTLNQDYFEKIDTEEKAYYLGFLYADGYNYQKKNRVVLSLAEQDVEIVNGLAKAVCYQNQIYTIKKKDENCQRMKSIIVVSEKMSNDLANLGCIQKKSLILRIPKIKEYLMRHFIRGYFDGDGCIYLKIRDKDNAFVIECPIVCSHGFAKDLIELIKERFGFDCYCQNLGLNKVTTTVKITGRLKAEPFLDWLYKDASVSLSRKENKYLEFKRMSLERVRYKRQ